ncbi:MAG: restriction endonuclease subunit S [Bacteroidales bacterium]|nr:restriction endonuclease subunit S [Bacteroidales bacterium]
MTGKQLKNAILQLAIQGKLVPQDANDEPASVLLAQIRKEKEQLLKAGKLKKKDLETTPIADEEKPFEIPESWEWVRLKDVFSMQAGKNINASELSQEKNGTHPYLCYGGNGVRGYIGKYNYEGIFPIVGRQGALCGCVNMATGKFQATEHAVVVTTYAQTNEFWAYYFLTASNLNQYATATAQPGLSVANILETFISLPPLAEQHRIVSKIEELMPLVEKYGAAQEKLNRLNEALPEALKKSILQQAIQGKLVPQDANDEPASALLAKIRKEKEQLLKAGKLKPACRQAGKKDLETTPISDEEKPFEIPESWEWVRLGFVINLLSGQDLTPDRYFDTEKGIPYITGASNFINGNLVISRWTDTPTSVSKKGDLLITCKGTVGAMAYNNIGDIHIARQVMAISPIEIHLSYIKVLLDFFVPKLEKQAHSIIPGISRDVLLGTIIPLPPLAEQKRIVAKIEELMAMVDGMK